MRALPLSRTARARFDLEAVVADAPTPVTAKVPARLAANLPAARRVVARVNATRVDGEPSAHAGELAALDLLHEIEQILIERAAELQPTTSMAVTAEAVRQAVGVKRIDGLLDCRGRGVPGRGAGADPGAPRGAAPPATRQREPCRGPAVGARRRCGAPAAGPERRDRRPRGVPGRPDPDRAQRRDAGRAAAGPGARPSHVARRAAALHPRALGRHPGRPPGVDPGPPAADDRRDRRGGARAPPAVRRRCRGCRRRRRGWRPRRGAQPGRPGRRAGAVLQRLRVDAAPRPHGQEHARVAGPAVPALCARHPDPGRDSRRGAGPSRALGDHGPLAHRPVGAQPGQPADQGLARQPGRGGVGLLAGRLRDRRRPGRRGRLGEPASPGLGARRAPGLGHGPQPHGNRLALGHRAPGVVPLAPGAPLPRLPVQWREPGRSRRGARSASRTTTGTTPTPPSSSSAATALRASGGTSTTATTARASPGTTPRSWTSARPRSGSR